MMLPENPDRVDASDDNRHHPGGRGFASNRLRVTTSKLLARATRLADACVILAIITSDRKSRWIPIENFVSFAHLSLLF